MCGVCVCVWGGGAFCMRRDSARGLTHLVWRGRGSNPRPADYEANIVSTRPPSRCQEQSESGLVLVDVSNMFTISALSGQSIRFVVETSWSLVLVWSYGGEGGTGVLQYIIYSSHYIRTVILHTGNRKGRQKSDEEKQWMSQMNTKVYKYTGI